MVIPEIEFDGEGYPTEDSIQKWEKLGKFDLNLREARIFLRDMLPGYDGHLGCSKITSRKVSTLFGDRIQVTFSTGGWSGAEDVIGVILKQFWIRYHHTMWQRGGLFIFEVPLD